MKQITRDTDTGTAVELEIDTQDVFSDDFKHYAKLLYLMMLHRTAMPEQTIVLDSVYNAVPESVSLVDMAGQIAASLAASARDAVVMLMQEITEELADPENLNNTLAELFGDKWDSEHRCFKEI